MRQGEKVVAVTGAEVREVGLEVVVLREGLVVTAVLKEGWVAATEGVVKVAATAGCHWHC